MSKKNTSIELCDHKRSYKGRLLGLVDDKEFHALMTKKRFQGKVFSCRTVPLAEIVSSYKAGFDGLRLVLAVREIDGEIMGGKHLFITEKLNYIGNESSSGVGVLGEGDEYYVIKEEV